MKRSHVKAKHMVRTNSRCQRLLCFLLLFIITFNFLPSNALMAFAQETNSEIVDVQEDTSDTPSTEDTEETTETEEQPGGDIEEPKEGETGEKETGGDIEEPKEGETGEKETGGDIEEPKEGETGEKETGGAIEEPKEGETGEEEITSEPSEPENPVYTNSISGLLWLDVLVDADNGIFAGDGVRQAEEEPLADYEVSLYKTDDKTSAVKTVQTQADGTYLFENLEPETYVVGISCCIKDGTEYSLPIAGLTQDNQFSDFNDEYTMVYSKDIAMETDTVVTGVNAGMRTPVEAVTTDIAMYQGEFIRNRTQIGFGGKLWWVIGDESADTPDSLKPPADCLFLFADKSGNFGSNTMFDFDASTAWPPPRALNNYNGSILQQKMKDAYDNTLTVREKNYVMPRADLTLPYNKYPGPYNQEFWPIAEHEYMAMHYPYTSSEEWRYTHVIKIRADNEYYWTRTHYIGWDPDVTNYWITVYIGAPNGTHCGGDMAAMRYKIRPAFYLDKSKMLFTSETSGTGMKPAAFGPALQKATDSKNQNPIKFTMETEDITHLNLALNDPSLTTITSHPNGTVKVGYNGAVTGAGKSVSVIICNKDNAALNPGKVLFYGRLLNCASYNSNGTATFTLPDKSDLPIGDYTLKIFNEEVNAGLYTDFASTPVTLNLRVRDVEVDLSANPDNSKVYYNDTTSGSVDITATVTNHTTIAGAVIKEAQWIRTAIRDTNDYSSANAFNSAYASTSISTANKGTLTRSSGNDQTAEFLLTADKNAKYWVKGTVTGGGNTYEAVSLITVDNLYKEITCTVSGVKNTNIPLYAAETIPGTYGIPFDLNGTTPLTAPSLGFDTITLSAKPEYIKYGPAKTKSNQPLTQTANAATVTLDGTINADCDGDYTKYTIFYTIQKYLVDRDDNGETIGSYATLQAAVNACIDNVDCTITATEDDTLTARIDIPATKKITLKSDSGNNWEITQNATVIIHGIRDDARHFIVYGNLTLEHITLLGLNKTGNTQNGGVRVEGASASLTMSDGAAIMKCHNYMGGGVGVKDGSLTMLSGSTISENIGAAAGGGVGMDGGSFTMEDGQITGNTTEGPGSIAGGGGVRLYRNANFIMKKGIISGNTATSPTAVRGGGGVIVQQGNFTMEGGQITGNTVSSPSGVSSGGGIYIGEYPYATVEIKGGTISGNKVSNGDGGGIFYLYSEAGPYTTSDNPLTPATNYYQQIHISKNAKVENNTASNGPSAPPANYLDFSDPAIRGTYTFDGLLLDNDNINYRNPNYSVIYKANNGGIGIQKHYQTTNISTGTTKVNAVSVGSAAGQADFTAPAGHVFAGWTEKADGNGAFYAPGDEITLNASNKTVTLYAKWVTTREVTVSKTVEGQMGDRNKSFTFTVYVEDADGTLLKGSLDYTGGVLSGSGTTAPADGTLTLDSSGSATFTLKHGQTITIAGVPAKAAVRIAEDSTIASGYDTEYGIDGGSAQTGTDTGVVSMAGANHTISFVNTHSGIAATGISDGMRNAAVLPALVILGLTGAAFAVGTAKRRRRHG